MPLRVRLPVVHGDLPVAQPPQAARPLLAHDVAVEVELQRRLVVRVPTALITAFVPGADGDPGFVAPAAELDLAVRVLGTAGTGDGLVEDQVAPGRARHAQVEVDDLVRAPEGVVATGNDLPGHQ